MGSLAGNLVCILDGADWEPSFMKIKVTFLHEGNDEVINHLELLEGSNTKSSEFTDEYNAATYDFSTHKFQYIDDFDAETERHHYWAAIAFMGLALLLLLGFLFSDIGKKA